MRRIYCILCTGALLLSSCQKLEFESQGNNDIDRLAFNASIDGMPLAQSRAASDDTKLTATGFFLAGYHTVGLMDASAATAFPNVFDKQIDDQQLPVPLVEYKDNKFTLKTIKWALDNVSYLSFFGWSQSKPFATSVDANTTGIIGQTYNNGDKGYPWIDIRNADAPLDQTDVVGARSIDNKNDAVMSAIDLDFRHLLSKLSFKAKSSSKATITIQEVNIVYATNKVNKKARYTFGSDPSSMGAYAFDGSEFHEGTQNLNNYNYLDIVAGAEVSLGSTMLIPQALQSGDVSIELKYQISPNSSAPGLEQSKTLPLSAFTFEQGNHYSYVIDIQATNIFVIGNPRVEDWNNVPYTQLPLILGPRDGKTLLLLDGYDKPYLHTDGNSYWLDRSGYNRHCKIMGGVTYDAVNKTYRFDGASSTYGEIISAFPSTSAATIDFVARSTRPASERGGQNVFSFTTNDNFRVMFNHFGYDGSNDFYFDGGETSASRYTRLSHTVSPYGYKRFAMYRATKNSSSQIFFRNQTYSYNTRSTGNGPHQRVDLSTSTNRRIGVDFKGEIKYLRVTNDAKTSMTDNATNAEFADLKERHDFEGEDYATSGILADFRLSPTLPIIDKINGWKMGSTNNSIAFDPSYNAFTIQGGATEIEGNPIKNLGTLGNATIEVRYISREMSEQTWGFSIVAPAWGKGLNCMMHRYQETDISNTEKVSIGLLSVANDKAGTYTFVRDKTNQQFRFYLDGVLKLTQNVSYFANDYNVGASMQTGFPGSNGYATKTRFQSIRMYNSVLTAEEIAHNAWLDLNLYVK